MVSLRIAFHACLVCEVNNNVGRGLSNVNLTTLLFIIPSLCFRGDISGPGGHENGSKLIDRM
jgi:hypothetical protein